MTKPKGIISRDELKQALKEDGDFLKPLVQTLVQEILEAEMEAVASRGRSPGRPGAGRPADCRMVAGRDCLRLRRVHRKAAR